MNLTGLIGNKFLSLINTFLVLITIIIGYYLVIFSINKGFDTTDEGLYLLLSDPLQQFEYSIFNHDVIFKFLYKYFGIHFNIIELRILRLVITVSSNLYLGFALEKFYLKINYINQRFFYYLLIIFASLTSYLVWAKTPGYNIFAINFTIISSASLLLFINQKNILFNVINLIIFALGSVFLYTTKVSTFVLIFGVQIILVFILSVNGKNIIKIISLLTSFLIMHYIWSLMFPKLHFLNVLQTIKNHSGKHNIIHLLIGYHGQIPLLIYSFLLGTLFKYFLNIFKFKRLAIYIFILLGSLHFLVLDLFISSQSIRLILFVFFLIGIVISTNSITIKSKSSHIIIYLLILPIILHFGSDTGLVENLIGYSISLFFVIFLIDLKFINNSIIILILSLFILKGLRSNLITNPNRQGPINEQIYLLEKNNHKIYVEKRIYDRIEKIDSIINTYNPNIEYLIAPHKLMGETALLKQSAYFNPIWGRLWGDDDLDIISAKLNNDKDLNECYLITNNLFYNSESKYKSKLKKFNFTKLGVVQSQDFDGNDQSIIVYYLKRDDK